MSELFASPFFGIALSILAFWVGVRIQKKTGLVVCNPLLIGIVLVAFRRAAPSIAEKAGHAKCRLRRSIMP